jgi:hypothetical protein
VELEVGFEVAELGSDLGERDADGLHLAPTDAAEHLCQPPQEPGTVAHAPPREPRHIGITRSEFSQPGHIGRVRSYILPGFALRRGDRNRMKRTHILGFIGAVKIIG